MSADYSFAIRRCQRTGFRHRHRIFSHGARGLVDVVFGAQNVIWVTEMIEANGPHYYQKPLKKLIFSAQDTENSIPNQLARSAKEGHRQILSWFPTSLNQTGRKPSLRFGWCCLQHECRKPHFHISRPVNLFLGAVLPVTFIRTMNLLGFARKIRA